MEISPVSPLLWSAGTLRGLVLDKCTITDLKGKGNNERDLYSGLCINGEMDMGSVLQEQGTSSKMF